MDITSTAGSSTRLPMTGSGTCSVRRHQSSSAARSGRPASSTNACAQRRTDVPTAGNTGVRPARTCCQAAARSGTSTRHVTPSTT
ncbi:hypothetical protein, partial [Streptomyces capoamus]|uniref:hypothetical protein n=1 Tax=Streptomyces capoamus TaxID=68183 RepID=UPI001E34E073